VARAARRAGGVLVAGALCVGLAVSGSMAATGAAVRGAGVPPSVPLSVSVAPDVGALVVSWQPPTQVGRGPLTYQVRSVPSGQQCSTQGLWCRFQVRDATPWRFTVSAANGAGSGPASPLTFPFRHLTVLVVAGQSNAIGFESYAIDPVTHRHVLATAPIHSASQHSLIDWVESGVPDSGATPVALSTPQQLVGAPSPIFGPEVGLASSLYAAGHQGLLIVKVAFAGTSLAVDWASSGVLYRHLVTTTRAAMAWASSQWWSATIGAIYWIQGETDAEHAPMAANYATHLRAFLRTLRSDLGVDARTPVVLARTDVTAYVAYKRAHHVCAPADCERELKGNAEVRAAQLYVAANMAYTYTVDTAGLPRFPTTFIHLTNNAELSLGRALAAVSLRRLT